MTVKELIEILQSYPPDSQVWAYEGERIGLGIQYQAPPRTSFIDVPRVASATADR